MEEMEISILRGLMYTEEYYQTVYPHLEEKFFEGGRKTIFNTFSELVDQYNEPPSMEAMAITIKKLPLNERDYNEVVDSLEEIYLGKDNPVNVEWLVNETESYCKDRAIYDGLYQCLSIIEGKEKKLDTGAIPDIMTDAINITFRKNLGMDYFEDAEKRFAYYTNPLERISLPLRALQIFTNGGFPKKTLNILLASTNVGKSAMMCWLSGELLKAGHNVLYISAEMSEEAVQERVDANLLDITTDELKDPNLDKDWFMGKIQKLKQKTTGRFLVKEYPTSQAHAGHVRFFLKEAKQKADFVPDIVFLDYINIFASSRYKSMSGVNSYSYIKAIAEEFRGLAVEFNIPIVSATQINRDGSKTTRPDMTDTSESFGLPATADWMAVMVTTEELMELNRQNMFVVKTRYGNKKNMAKGRLIGIDFDKMRYYDVETDSDEQQEIDNKLKESSPEKKPKGNLISDWTM